MPLVRNRQLIEKIFDPECVEQAPTRKGYGEGLLEAGEKNPRVVALCADLTESTQTHIFAKKFPERFIPLEIIPRRWRRGLMFEVIPAGI